MVTRFPNRTDKAIAMKMNHEKRRLAGTLRDPFPHLNPLRQLVYGDDNKPRQRGTLQRPDSIPAIARSTQQPAQQPQQQQAVKEHSNPHSSPQENKDQYYLLELRKLQLELLQQRRETRHLIEHVLTVAQEVNHLRKQLSRFDEH